MYGERSSAGILEENRSEGRETIARDDDGGATLSAGEKRSRRAGEKAAAGSRRLPVLDGIRAIAIGFVLLSHVLLEFRPLRTSALVTGPFGVSMFLVLSGFLITRVMLEDEKRAGTLRLGRFYWRRGVRILPALYVFLAALAGLSAVGLMPRLTGQEWLSSFLCFRNLTDSKNLQTGHLWSLSLEEQFYFCWPALFILTSRFRMKLIVAAILLLTAMRIYWVYSGGAAWQLYTHPALRMDTFLIGGVFAIGRWPWVREIPAGLFGIFLVLWFPLSLASRPTQVISTPVSAFLIGALIVWTAESKGRFSRLLARSTPVLIGELSYSIYLWQQLFLGEGRVLYWWTFPALAAVSIASYWLVERPMLRLKNLSRPFNFSSVRAFTIAPNSST